MQPPDDGQDVALVDKGYVDFYGVLPAASGWFFCGWMSADRARAADACGSKLPVVVGLEGLSLQAMAVMLVFDREDIRAEGIGVALYIGDVENLSTQLLWLKIDLGTTVCQLNVVQATQRVREEVLVSRLAGVLDTVFAGPRVDVAALLSRRGYAGLNTMDSISHLVRVGIDEVRLCGSDGILIFGWVLSSHRSLRSLSLCHGGQMTPLNRARFMKIPRPDVTDALGASFGAGDLDCGFVAFVDVPSAGLVSPYIVVETDSQEIGFIPLTIQHGQGLTSIKRLLDVVDLEFDHQLQALRDVIVPAVQRLNLERLATPPDIHEIEHGRPADRPLCTLIIPLYGRIDYLEYQLGLLSDDPEAARCDIIYVLDDPRHHRAAMKLAESVYVRFKLNFRLLILRQNLGYAPASNIGLTYARSDYVCFLNSDVFPKTPGWIGRLRGHLEADPHLGVVSGILLFEDGSVQHEGIRLETIPGLGGLRFPLHPRKGWRPRRDAGLEPVDMITGACMMMPISLAVELEGFDESYVIGDFEDCDLCARLSEAGKTCAVDHAVQLYHLERRSQQSPGARWRRNLTLYNAWVFNTRHAASAVAAG